MFETGIIDPMKVVRVSKDLPESPMHIRIVVADRSEARFYDVAQANAPLVLANSLQDEQARQHDRDFKSDRPGRVFDHAPGNRRRGAVAHHATGGENTPRNHEAELFAARVGAELEQGRRDGRFERWVLMAEPGFLGTLRSAIPQSLHASLALEVHKDLVHQDEAAIKAHLPQSLFT